MPSTMNDNELRQLLDRWQAAMRRRDQLQQLRDGLGRVDGVTFRNATLTEIEEALAKAEAEVAELQQAVLQRR